jgi:alcohol dehydrogenase class IV
MRSDGADARTVSAERFCDALIAWALHAGVFPIRGMGQHLRASVAEVGELCAEIGVRRVLLVIDRGAAAATGTERLIRAALRDVELAEYDGFAPNPRDDHAEFAARAAASFRADGVVALGGGSCLDVAKVAAVCGRTPEACRGFLRGAAATTRDGDGLRPVPLIAVPTTSGTGSEATHFGAIYVEGTKRSVAHPGMRPSGVVLDPALHAAMPAGVAAATGLDALCQAMESIWAVGSTPESAVFAEAAAWIVAQHLVESVRTGSERERGYVMVGAHLAGQAINLSKTTLSHALSYGLTQRFGLAHGHAVALTIGHVAACNARVIDEDCADPRGAAWVRGRVEAACAALGVTPALMPARVERLLADIGLVPTLAQGGVPLETLVALARAVDPVRGSNNPRRFTEGGLVDVLTRAWRGVGGVGAVPSDSLPAAAAR